MTALVVAVTVTYRRPELLADCLAAVLGQTRRPDSVLVVDNDGSAGLHDGAEVIDPGQNLGPAGGYALGIERALAAGATHVWTVDDDCIPDADCLATLLETGHAAPEIRIPLQRTADGGRGFPPSWNGTLFDAVVLRAVGGPRPAWFFWKEDADLVNRAADAGFTIRHVSEAAVDHRKRKPDYAREGRDWRLYYETRNALTYRIRTHRRTWKDVPIAWRHALSTAWHILRYEPSKVSSLGLWGKGVADHLLHRLGRRVDPAIRSDPTPMTRTSASEAPPIFVVGCGRSGTTVLRLILNAHPDLAIPPEAQFVDRLVAGRRRYSHSGGRFDGERLIRDLLADPRFQEWEMPEADVRAHVPQGADFSSTVSAPFRAYAALHGKTRWGDKTPDHVRAMPILSDLWPDGRFVHLIRDGRDVAGSLARTPFGPKTVVEQARYWARRVRAGRTAGRALGPSRYLEVRYESLVEHPETELRRICEFAGLTFDPAMLDHARHSAGTIPPSEMGHQRGALEPLRPGLRDWRIDMSPRDVAAFQAAEGRLLHELGYERAGGSAPFAWMKARVADARERLDLRRRLRRAIGRAGGTL